MQATLGIEQYEQQQYWNLLNINRVYDWPFEPYLDIGMWRCWGFQWAYASFHWFYLYFVDPNWKYWWATEGITPFFDGLWEEWGLTN